MNRLCASRFLFWPLFVAGTLGACRSSEAGHHPPAPEPSTATTTAGADRTRALPGFLELAWDQESGTLRLVVPAFETPLLYVVSLPWGLGSNDVGLDRGQLGERTVVEFRRVGGRVLLVAPNFKWRSSSPAAVERRGVATSFAESVLWGFEDPREENGQVSVDATAFFLRDAHGIARTLEDAGQGAFRLDPARSALVADALASFPLNSEIEALLTFTADAPGREVAATTPVPTAVSLRVRHSFVALPKLDPERFRPRDNDPRAGYFGPEWNDLAQPIDRSTQRALIARHALSAEHPIVYRVDRAAPEPVRTALLEGARYWEPVFARAGFPGGFRVELLPEDADPADVRYNVIQWVNRSTRGWSYGDTLTDPRTGEILKGHVTLGALRVRQDVLLFQGLVSPYHDGVDVEAAAAPLRAAALARIRQLAAHEVGHTLGLQHNFAASAFDRASVMDYPAPRIGLTETGDVDLSDAYAPGCGAWDELAIRYGYAVFADEEAGRRGVLEEMRRSGIPFLSDSDARGADRSHPLANLWDDGADPLVALRHSLRVRATGLARFGPSSIRPGESFARLEQVLVPLYFHHRFQVEAAIRAIGGVSYAHRVRGEDPARLEPVPSAHQAEALALVLETLAPSFLALPESVRTLIPPPPPGERRGRESFEPGGHLFDPHVAAEQGAELVVRLLLDEARAARLVDQGAAGGFGLDELIRALVEATWSLPATGPAPPPATAVRDVVLDHLIRLARDARPRVAAGARFHLIELGPRLRTLAQHDPHADRQAAQVLRFLEDPTSSEPARPPTLPPGSPIGCSGDTASH